MLMAVILRLRNRLSSGQRKTILARFTCFRERKGGCSIALTESRIAELENKGFKRWQKGNMDRLYINACNLGLDCTYYKTGNISGATFQGYSISNCEARRMKAAKAFINVVTEKVMSTNTTLGRAAAELAGLEYEG